MGSNDRFFVSAEAIREHGENHARMRRTADRIYQALLRARAADLPENAPGYAQLISKAQKLIQYHDKMAKALDRVADGADEMQAASRAALSSASDAVYTASVRAGESLSRLE